MNKFKPFLQTPTKTNTKSFNSTINFLSSQSSHHEVLTTFSSMLTSKTPLDTFTFPSLFKACASLSIFSLGLSLHQQVIVNGFSSDPFIASSLIHFYSKMGRREVCQKLFDEMPERDVVHYTALIGCYSRVGEANVVFLLFNEMRCGGIKPVSVTLLAMLSGVCEIVQLKCLHGFSVLNGFVCDVAVVNSILNVYCRCGSVGDAKELFKEMEKRDVVSWNSLISGYAQIGGFVEVLQLLFRMRCEGIQPDHQMFGSFVSGVARHGDLEIGKMVHGQIVRAGFDTDTRLKTSILVMYLKCGDVEAAFGVFGSIPGKDVICWTAMISGLMQNDCLEKALIVFCEMLNDGLEPSSEAIASVLAACAQLGSFELGASVHGYVLRQGMLLDIPALNSLITMYAKCSRLEQSGIVFERMEKRDLVSWNAIISGYAQNGHLGKAFSFFNEMKSKTLQRPDSLTFVSLLQTCASTGALIEGKLIHNVVIRSGITPCVLVGTALVDMYSKCGYLKTAQKCFDVISQKDLVSWSTIIAGYGFHGQGKTALSIYYEFLRSGMQPNHVIFLSVLASCSHSGLVRQGLSIFNSMTRDFGVEPKHEHLACVVDLLCRARRLEEAYKFYKEKFSKPSIDVLGMILDACRANINTKLSDIISRDMFKLRHLNAGNYVQLAHCYASMNRWDAVGDAWTQMRSLGLRKLPGWSFIEISGKITTFFMDHNSHPQFNNIVSVLEVMNAEMRKTGHHFQTSHIHDIS